MWTGLRLDAERGGSDVGSRFIPAGDWPRAEEARATFPPARLSPSLLKRTAWPVHYGFLEKTAGLVRLWSWERGLPESHRVWSQTLSIVAQESWGHYVSVLTPGVRKSFCAIWSRDRRPVFPVVGDSINVFLIGTDGSVKLALAPFCFAPAIKENSKMCSLHPRKYTNQPPGNIKIL